MDLDTTITQLIIIHAHQEAGMLSAIYCGRERTPPAMGYIVYTCSSAASSESEEEREGSPPVDELC